MPAYGGATYGGAAYAGPLVTGTNLFHNFWANTITEIAFASNPLDNPAVWTDVSVYVQSITANRGRQHELNRFEAGTVTVVLKNLDGRFSPFNGSSPYSPNVKPGVQLRIRSQWNGIVWPIFRGHIEAWPVKWPGPADSTVTVQAVDATKILNLKRALQFTPTYQTTVLADSPTVLYMLNDPPGSTTAADTSGQGSTGILSGLSPSTPPAFLGAAPVLTADASTCFDCGSKNNLSGQLFTNGTVTCPPIATLASGNDWSIECWLMPRSTPNSGGDYIASAGNGAQYFKLTLQSDQTITAVLSDGTTVLTVNSVLKLQMNQANYVTVCWQSATKNLQVAINGTQVATGSNSIGSFNVGGSGANALFFGLFDGTLQAVGVYAISNLLTTNRPAAHYAAGAFPLSGQTTGQRISSLLTAVGWSATLQKIDTGQIAVQPGTRDLLTNTALANCQVTADTEFGDLFIDAGGNVVFYDQTHRYRTPNGTAAVVLGDSGTTGPGGESPYLLDSVDIAFDDIDIYNEAAVTPANLGAQVASDVTSQTTYGKRTLARSGIHYTPIDAKTEAQMLVDKFKSPLQRIRQISFTPLSDPDVLFPAALGFELLTRVTVKRRPKDGAGSTFTQDSLIEGIEHVITPGGWTTTWRLSPTDATPLFFVLDDPVAGQLNGAGVLV